MTQEEAIVLMKQGVKVTHNYFSSNEWMTISQGQIILEDGVKCSINEFFSYRKAGWEDGYSQWK